MFPAPACVDAEVFCTIPDSFKVTDRSSEWAEIQLHGRATPAFLEGPSFDREGNLWVVDIPWGRIFRIDPAGVVTIAAEYDGEPNGLKFHRDGRAFIADHKHGIMTLDPSSGRIETLLSRSRLERFRGVNDLVFSRRGDLYFTDQGQTGLQDAGGRLYRLDRDGRLDLLLDGIPSPNGLVLNNAETAIFLAVTRDNAVWRIPLLADGRPSKVGVFIQMSGGTGPDGIAIDVHDNLAVCHVGLGAVWLFSSVGEPMLRINVPGDRFVTNCAFGGADNRTLFITSSMQSSIVTARMPFPGGTMFSHLVD